MDRNFNLERLSVIMGVYNAQGTLAQSLESLLVQSYQDFTVIICDDGSTDATYEIMLDYNKKYPDKFTLIRSEKNYGLSHALNLCLKKVTSEYCARMDADDTCDCERFKKQVEFLDNNYEFALVSSNAQLCGENACHGMLVNKEFPHKKDLARRTQFCHAAVMMRSSVLKELGGYDESEKFKRVEDYELWVRLYAKGYCGYNIQEPLYHIRDDKTAYKRRRYIYRINEARVCAKAVHTLSLPFYLYVYALYPLIIGLMPQGIYTLLRKLKRRQGKTH